LAFGGNNPKRLTYLYSPLEFKSLQLFNGFFETRKVFHELPIKLKDDKNKTHFYHLDFYDLATNTNIEISPKFHETYKKVKDSDNLRSHLLKSKLGIKTLEIKANNIKDKTLEKQIKKTIRIIKKSKPNNRILDNYF